MPIVFVTVSLREGGGEKNLLKVAFMCDFFLSGVGSYNIYISPYIYLENIYIGVVGDDSMFQKSEQDGLMQD